MLPPSETTEYILFSPCLCVKETAIALLGCPGCLCGYRKVVCVGTDVAIGNILLDGKQIQQPHLGRPNNLVEEPLSGADTDIYKTVRRRSLETVSRLSYLILPLDSWISHSWSQVLSCTG